MRRAWAPPLGALCVALLAAGPAPALETAPDEGVACKEATAAAEVAENLPTGLLTAIARVESGRGAARTPWPWTINAGGKGYYFATKTEAIAAAQARLAEGSRWFDVGCVQINLHWHPDSFPTLDDAFDPDANAAYGARYLRTLFEQHGDWGEAVARYHSPNEERQIAYAGRVLRAWNPPGLTEEPAVPVRRAAAGRGPQPKLYTLGDGGAAMTGSLLVREENGVRVLRPSVGLD